MLRKKLDNLRNDFIHLKCIRNRATHDHSDEVTVDRVYESYFRNGVFLIINDKGEEVSFMKDSPYRYMFEDITRELIRIKKLNKINEL